MNSPKIKKGCLTLSVAVLVCLGIGVLADPVSGYLMDAVSWYLEGTVSGYWACMVAGSSLPHSHRLPWQVGGLEILDLDPD